jgi:hypothetical protein
MLLKEAQVDEAKEEEYRKEDETKLPNLTETER